MNAEVRYPLICRLLPVLSLVRRNEPMSAKPGRPCLLALFLVTAVIAGAGVRSQEPTQEAKSQKPEQENAAPPTGKTRPTIKGNSQGWLPIHMVADKDTDRAAIVADLNAAGFDAIDEKFYPNNRGYILAAPRPTGTWDESLALAKEILRKNSGALVVAPPPDYSTLPHSFTSVKWKPKQADAETRERELLKVVDALADSDLPLRHIGHDLRRDGTNYLWLIYTSSAADDVEAFVRRVVEEPAIWPPNSILLPGDKSPTLHALQPATDGEAASRPGGLTVSGGGPVRLGSEVTIELPSEGDRSTIRRTLEAEGYDISEVEEESTWTIYLPSEADIEASVARVREVVGPTVKVKNPDAFDIPAANIERAVRRPVSFWFFTWTPENQDRAKQEAERGRVEDAFVKSGLGVERIHWSGGGADRIRAFVASPPDKIPQIEELVRTLVKEPKFWHPPQWDKYLAERAAKGMADEAVGDLATADPPPSAGSEAVVEEPATKPSEPPATPAETSQSSPFAAKVLLIESDWEKANDRQAASRLAQSISNGIVEMNRAGAEVFRPGFAATFERDEARTVSEDMQRLGLVRQSLAMSAVDLGLSQEGVEALGAAQLSFGDKSADGTSETVVWNVLIVTAKAQGHFASGNPYSAPAPVRIHRVAVVAWKDRTAERRLRKDGSTATEAGELVPPAADASPPAPSDESERYVGSFFLRTDQSAIVPLTVPGVKGAAIVVSRAPKGPAVRSLGPLSGAATQQPMTADASIDWNELIRAYEASPLGAAATRACMVESMEDVSESAETGEAEVTFNWRPAKEEQIDPLIDALAKRYPQAQVVLRQLQGDRGATLVISAPASSAEMIAKELETIAAAIIPSESVMQVEISPKVPEQEDQRATLVFHLVNASSDEVAKLLETLKLDPNIRLVSDPRTNSILLSAPDATKYKHVQALIDLLKALDQPAEATPAKDESASTGRPDRRAEIDALRARLAREEADVQQAAELARAAPERERSIWVDSLRQVVVRAFDLRLRLQREEAAELRDRLAKIEENLARRQRIQSAVIERRIEVLLDPALEWPEVAPENAPTPEDVAAATPAVDDPSASSRIAPSLPPQVWAAPGLGPSDRRGDAFSAATSLAREIADLEEQAQAIDRDGTPDGSEVRLALIRRQLDLLRQEFDARQQALKLELESLKAKLNGAQASYERVQTLIDTGAASQGELANVEAELSAAKSDVARQEVLLQQYDKARASLLKLDERPEREWSSATEEPNKDPSALRGAWRLTRLSPSLGNSFRPPTDEMIWTFDADTLTEIRPQQVGEPIRFVFEIEHSDKISDAFTRIGSSAAWRGASRLGRYEVRGTKLRVVMRGSPEATTFPEVAAPEPSDQLFEFEHIDDASSPSGLAAPSGPLEGSHAPSMPAELLGTWRMTKHEVQDNPDSNVAPTTWILEGLNLTVKRKGLEDVVYVLEFPQDSPDEFRSFRVAKIPQGREIVERGFRYRYEIRDGALHVIQGAGDGRSLHKSVSPAPGVVYYEFERVAAGAGDEREPGASGPDSPAASSSSVNAEAQAERAATTALALRAADLYMEIRRIESQVPPAPHRDLAVSMLREQIDRLRKELEERRADVRKERAAHAVKLAVVQTRLDRAQRLATPKAQDLSITQAELASASATLASVDGVLATFDAAVEAFDEASRSNALPPDFGDDASGQALKRLQGFWVSTEQNGYSRFGTFSPEHAQIWLFAGKSMIWTGFASDAGYLYDVQIAGDADPPRLTLVFDGTPQSPASIRDYGFRFDGDDLEVAERQDVSVDVDEVAPQPGIQYYRFERYGALAEALASFDIDAVDIEAIKNEGIQLPTSSQPAGSRTQGRDTSSFAEPIATARSHLRSLAIALVKSRDALQSSLDPALPAAESRRLRSQSYSQRAESFRHRDQFFAEKCYVESALANVRIRVESAASAEEREAIESTQEKLAEYLTEIDRLARVARLPAPVALGPATGDPWYPYVNAEQGAYEPELSLTKHADELRKAEAQLAGLAPEDPAHQRALERRDYLLNGAREIRAFWRAALIRAEETIDETRSALSKAKRSQGSLGQSLDDVEREIAIAREEHRIARSTEIIDEYGRRLTELASAFPSLVEDAENDKTDASSSIPLSR